MTEEQKLYIENNKLNLAPDVLFYPKEHEYWLNGKQLSGITKLIAKRLNMKFTEEVSEKLSEMQKEGIHVHEAIAKWIDGEPFESDHAGAIWVKDTIHKIFQGDISKLQSEVLVSDLKRYASAVDVVAINSAGGLMLFDIKRSFKREYVTWQLSVYKYLIEAHTKHKVASLWCICVKDRDVYSIYPYDKKDVKSLLYALPIEIYK